MEQVCGFIGAGQHLFWRRWAAFLAQVGFWVGDLRRKSWFCALCWRRSPPFFLTCAKTPNTPAPTFSTTCANGWYNLNWFHHLTNQVEGEGRLRGLLGPYPSMTDATHFVK